MPSGFAEAQTVCVMRRPTPHASCRDTGIFTSPIWFFGNNACF
jgi:hypothetical protein